MKHDNEGFDAQITEAVGAMDGSDAFVLVHFDADGDGGHVRAVNDEVYSTEQVGEVLLALLGNHIRYLAYLLDMTPREVVSVAALQSADFEVGDGGDSEFGGEQGADR